MQLWNRLTLTPRDHPDRAGHLKNLGTVLESRFAQTGSMDDLNAAVEAKHEAVKSTPDDHPNRAAILQSLGNTLCLRFQRTASMDDLMASVEAIEEALEATPLDHPNRAMYLNSLCITLNTRFKRTGLIDDLNAAVESIKSAIKSTPNDHPNRATYLNTLGNALESRFARTGSMDDLNSAVEASEEALKSTPDDQPDRPMRLYNLSIALQSRFKHTGSMADLNAAVELNDDAVKATQHDHPDRARRLNSLSIVLHTQFRRTGSMDDLDAAVKANEEAIKSTPDDHPYRAMYLNNLGTALQSRFKRTGLMDDLNAAVEAIEEAVKSTPHDHPDRESTLSNLSSALVSRFNRMGSMDDLNAALEANEQAVKLTPEDHPDRPSRLNNLGSVLQSRFERIGSMHDLTAAMEAIEEALRLSPCNHPNRARYLDSLSHALQRRFERTGSIDDLNAAVKANEEAIKSTPHNHPDRATILANLGCALASRFVRTGSMDDLNAAVEADEKAAKSTPDDHPNRAIRLNNLGIALERRFKREGSKDDLDRAIETIEQAVAIRTAPPSVRIKAASSASRLLIGRNWDRANAVLRVAVNLLPTTSPRTLTQLDRQYNISKFAGITSQAVSVSVQCGESPYRALQLSELGNGVLASLQIQVRSDVVVLKESHPDLARQFYDLRDELDRPPSNFIYSTESPLHDDAQNRRNLSNKFDTLLATIRQKEGFDNFLLAPSESDLKTLATLGVIIVFNVSEIRSDAFIVTVDDIHSVPLPLLTNKYLEAYARRFLNTLKNGSKLSLHASAGREMHEILKWLWDVAVGPVLDKLGFTQAHSVTSVRPRVWWVGSGLLNILPIHAAGYHEMGSTRNAIDCVVSSYTPTLKALVYARERQAKAARHDSQKALLVGMPKTPGLNGGDLPFVATEIDELNKLFCSCIQTSVMQNPTREQVLSSLRSHQIVHFSCHGYSSAVSPSDSHLLLNDWQISPLTVSDLTTLNIPLPQFAFLSACHSASSKDFNLLSESINLSSAVQLAGYPSVVGTLWQVGDKQSAELAKELYRQMLIGGKLDIEYSADSLHHAVCKLREKTRIPGFGKIAADTPLVWAPYIHIGV